MKESPPVVRPQATTKSCMQSTTKPPVAPPVEQLVPGEHHIPIIPYPPLYANTLVPPPVSEPITPCVPLVPVTEETSAPIESPEGLLTSPGDEHVVIFVPDLQPVVLPAEPINVPSQVSSEALTASPLVEPSVEPLKPPPAITSTTEPVVIPRSPTTNPLTEAVTSFESSVVVSTEPIELVETLSSTLAAQPAPVDPETSPSAISIPAPIQSVLEESAVSQSGSASDVVLPDEMPSKMQIGPSSTEEPAVPHVHQVEEPVVPSFVNQLEVFPPQTRVVNEEMLRKHIREDLQKLLNEEMKMAECNIRQQLEEEKAKAKVQAQSAARLQIQDEVQKLLEEDKASHPQTLADAIRREQLNIQDERLITQYYWMDRKAQKLEEMQKDLENQDALFREQIAKMQEKMVQFTKVTAENYRKGLEDTHNRFRRCQIKPVCSDLQSKILKCYAENKGQTMSCSNIGSLYIQCVDRARQGKKRNTGG